MGRQKKGYLALLHSPSAGAGPSLSLREIITPESVAIFPTYTQADIEKGLSVPEPSVKDKLSLSAISIVSPFEEN